MTAPTDKESSNGSAELSGLSLALGLISVGILIGLLSKEPLGSATPYCASSLIVLGLAILFFELEEQHERAFGLSNAGLGVLFFAPSLWVFLTYAGFEPRWASILVDVVLVIFMVLGAAGTIDGVGRVFIAFFSSGVNLNSLFKALGFALTLIASSLAIVNQVAGLT